MYINKNIQIIATDNYLEQILEKNRKSKHTRKTTLRTNLPNPHLEQKTPHLEQKRPEPHTWKKKHYRTILANITIQNNRFHDLLCVLFP